MIPESQHSKSFVFKPFVSSIILITLHRMLTAIDLDDQMLFKTNEIRYEISHWLLSSKF